MGERSGYEQGVPSWLDLGTSDPEGARAFYGGLFGWEFDISPDPEFGGYAQATLRGKRVAGLGGRMDESMPVVWTTYFAVDDADKVAEAVAEHGGTVVVAPMAVGEHGRMAIGIDPTGAAFGLWEGGSHRGAQLVNEPGTATWNDLATSDLDAATRFYSNALGVDWADMDPGMPGMTYKVLKAGGRSVAGAMPAAQQPGDAPSHWNVYFAVDDAAAAADRVRELGGQVYGDVMPTPQGPMALVSDPQGAMFFVIAMDEPGP